VTWDVGETKVRKALISINVRAGDPAVSQTLSRGEIGPEERHELVPNVEDEGDRRRTLNPTVSTLVMPPPPIVHRSNEPLDVHGYTWHREEIISPIGGPVRRRKFWRKECHALRDLSSGYLSSPKIWLTTIPQRRRFLELYKYLKPCPRVRVFS
jgi:hypothetical protein